MESISTILIEQWYIIYLYMLMCIVHMWIFPYICICVYTCIWPVYNVSWPSFIMRKYIRGCKVRFYHAQYIPWNIKPLKTYMASKACHPNECFDTTLCYDGIFPVTRPFLFLAHYPNVLLLCYARVSSPPARVPGKCRCQTQSNEPHECLAIVLCNHAPAVTSVRGRYRCQKRKESKSN